MRSIFTLLMVLFFSTIATGREYHVTPAGDDTQSGTDAAPLKNHCGSRSACSAGRYDYRPRGGLS
jgi:hypothetical protein